MTGKRLLSTLLTFCLLLSLLPGGALAEDNFLENDIYKISADGKTLTIKASVTTELETIPSPERFETVVIQSGVTTLMSGGAGNKYSMNPFEYFTNLKSIVIDNNKTYSVKDDVLFDIDQKVILCYPAQKPETSFYIPDGVEKIVSRAFSPKNCYLEKLYASSDTKAIIDAYLSSNNNWSTVPEILTAPSGFESIIAVTGVTLDRASLSLSWDGTSATGSTAQLAATVSPEDATEKRVTWSSSDETVATVDENGLVTARGEGSAIITATAVGINADSQYVSATCAVRVYIPVNKMDYYPSTAISGTPDAPVPVNRNAETLKTLQVQLNSEATDHEVIWSSEASGVALLRKPGTSGTGDASLSVTAGSDGVASVEVVPAGESGSVKITAVSKENAAYKREFFLELSNWAESVSLNESSTVLYVGDKEALSVVTDPANADIQTSWSSSDTGVATVDDKGTVTGVASGRATITAAVSATVNGEKVTSERTCAVEVRQQLTGITLDRTALTLNLVDQTKAELVATFIPSGAYNINNLSVTWESSAPEVAELSNAATTAGEDGGGNKNTVTAKKPGTATITVTVEDARGKHTAICEVTVDNTLVESLELDPGRTVTMLTTDTPKVLTITPKGKNGSTPTNTAVSWTSGDTSQSVVKVESANDSDTSLKLTAVAPGETKIHIVARDGSHTTTVCEVYVYSPVTGVELNTRKMTLVLGGESSKTLSAKVLAYPSADQTVTWTSGNENCVTVENGVVTAVGPGKTYVRATAPGTGFYDECEVTVLQPTQTIKLEDKNGAEVTGDVNLSLTGENPIDEAMLTAVIFPDDITDEVVWQSSEPAIVSVGAATSGTKTRTDVDGSETKFKTSTVTIKAEDGGEATITATSGDKSVSCPVKIPMPVKNIALDQTDVKLEKGGAVTLTATVSPDNAANGAVEWKSSDTTVATVDENGVVKALKDDNSTATITVTAKDGSGKSASCVVTAVPVAVTGVTLDPTELTGKVGDTDISVTATIAPSDAKNKETTWTVSDENVITITTGYDSEGKPIAYITPKKVGTATLTAKTKDGNKTATCEVTVEATTVESIEIAAESTAFDLNAGSNDGTKRQQIFTATLNPTTTTNKTVRWTSSDPSVAMVGRDDTEADDDGVASVTVIAMKPGEVTITAAAAGTDGEVSDSLTFTIPVAVTGVSLDPGTVTLDIGDMETLTPVIAPSNAATKEIKSWRSSDESVATVSDSGDVTAMKAGTATITVTTEDGAYTATCTVTVRPNPGSDSGSGADSSGAITVDPETLTLKPGEPKTLKTTVSPAEANQAVIWTGGDDYIATLKDNGDGTVTVTGVANGTTRFTVATVVGDVSKNYDVTVETPATGVRIWNWWNGEYVVGTLTVYTDETAMLGAVVLPEGTASNSKVGWTSSDESVVEVLDGDDYAELHPLSAGTATITVTTEDGGYTYSCTVEVRERATELKMSEEILTLAIGGVADLTVSAKPDGAYMPKLEWSSDSEDVAIVTTSGKVVARSEGETIITAMSEDGIYAECRLTVYRALTSLKIQDLFADGKIVSSLKLDILEGAPNANLDPYISPENATVTEYKWESSDEDVVEVASGLLFVHGTGTATITLTAVTPGGDVTANCEVTVEKAKLKYNRNSVLYMPDSYPDDVSVTLSPYDGSSPLTYEYKKADGTSGSDGDIAIGYTGDEYTYYFAPSENGVYKLRVAMEENGKYEGFGETFTITALRDPITDVTTKNLANDESLSASVDNFNYVISVSGYVNRRSAELSSYDLANKLDFTMAEVGSISGLRANVTSDGSKVEVRYSGRVICEYTLDRSGIVSLPENVSLDSSMTLVADSDNSVSAANLELTTETETALKNAAVSTIMEAKNLTSETNVNVTLNISPASNSSGGVESVSLDVTPSYVITESDGTKTTGTLDTLASAIPISIRVNFKPKVVLHKNHNGMMESLPFTVTADGGSYIVSWSQQTFSEVRLLAENEVRSGSIRFQHDDGYVTTPYSEASVGAKFEKDSGEEGAFTGWKITVDNNTVAEAADALTDELLTAINGKTAVATPVFTGDEGGAENDPPAQNDPPAKNDPPVRNDPAPTRDRSGSSDSSGSYDASGTVTKPETKPEEPKPSEKPETPAVSMENPFADVLESDYYYAPVLWAAKTGVTTGRDSADTFVPAAPCTREEAVTFLWRAAGCPEPEAEDGAAFRDLNAKHDWSRKAILWAVETGITNGTDAAGTRFSPDAIADRAQIVTFLYRYARLVAGAEVAGEGSGFADVRDDDYFAAAVQWAVARGVTNGTSADGTRFSPLNLCQRGQIVTFLYRYFVEPLNH